MSDLTQLIYASQPFGYDSAMLGGILIDARRCNQRDGITGALVCRHDIFLQLLEGPADKVAATFARISGDDRHTAVNILHHGPVTGRIFGDWAMLHDPAQTWMWTQEEIDGGILDHASAAEIVAMFEKLAVKSAA